MLLERPGEEGLVDRVDLGVRGVCRRDLLGCRGLDYLAEFDDRAGFGRHDGKAEGGRVDQRIDHSAIGGIDLQGPDARNLDRDIEAEDEAGHIPESDALAATFRALCRNAHQPARRLKRQLRHRLDHRDHAGLEHAVTVQSVLELDIGG